MSRLTGVSGLRDDFRQKLGEVGHILAHEASFDNEGLTGMVGSQLTTKELGLADDSQAGSLVGVLMMVRLISSSSAMFRGEQTPALKANPSRPTVKPGAGW
jgi:hypothetical protein